MGVKRNKQTEKIQGEKKKKTGTLFRNQQQKPVEKIFKSQVYN